MPVNIFSETKENIWIHTVLRRWRRQFGRQQERAGTMRGFTSTGAERTGKGEGIWKIVLFVLRLCTVGHRSGYAFHLHKPCFSSKVIMSIVWIFVNVNGIDYISWLSYYKRYYLATMEGSYPVMTLDSLWTPNSVGERKAKCGRGDRECLEPRGDGLVPTYNLYMCGRGITVRNQDRVLDVG